MSLDISISQPSHIDVAYAKLKAAVTAGLPRSRCLRRWSEFVRLRDGERCVDCNGKDHLSAHHICRKSFLPQIQFDTGNGITLCRGCHRDAHRGFNGRADAAMPVDAQGAEKLELMERFYSILLDDATERGTLQSDWYDLAPEFLQWLGRLQGYNRLDAFDGNPLERAYLLLTEPERCLREAIADANGFAIVDGPMLPGGMLIETQDGERISIRTYQTRS